MILPFTFGDDEFNLNDAVSAVCTITKGDQPLIIWWTVIEADDPNAKEKNLTTSDEIEIRNNKRSSMLSIDSVKARHRGNFSCHAKNKAGYTSITAQLAINGDFTRILFLPIFKTVIILQFAFHILIISIHLKLPQ